MNFFDVAKNMELQAIKTYTRLSKEAPLDQLKGVFNVLAEEEKRHYDLFDTLQNKSVEVPADENILSRSKALLSKWERDFKAPGLADLRAAYEKGMQTEHEAVDFYSKEREMLENDNQKQVVEIIINQEKRHIVLFENLIEFVQRPQQWLENAEFNHLDEY
jgi:rubrerythrin